MCLFCLLSIFETAHEITLRTFSPEPSLFAHMKYGSRRRVRPKIRHLAPLDQDSLLVKRRNDNHSPGRMAAHARLKNEFTEDEKYHNLMSWLFRFCIILLCVMCWLRLLIVAFLELFVYLFYHSYGIAYMYEPRHDKTCLRGFSSR